MTHSIYTRQIRQDDAPRSIRDSERARIIESLEGEELIMFAADGGEDLLTRRQRFRLKEARQRQRALERIKARVAREKREHRRAERARAA